MSESPVAPERLARILTLLYYLLDETRGDRIPLRKASRDLGLAPAEVREDLELLNLVNHGGGTYLIFTEIEEGDTIVVSREPLGEDLARPARLSPLMARALLLALDLVGDALPVEGQAGLTSARDKIRAAIAGLDIPGAVSLENSVAPDAATIRTINSALRERRVVRLEYYTATREELLRRDVEPYLLFHSGNAWYLEAFCLRAQQQRTFRLDMVRSAALTERVFEPRPEVDLSGRHATPLATAAREPRFALVDFAAEKRAALAEQGVTFTVLEDGRIRARIPYLDERWLVREVLRSLGGAVLVSPAPLRERVARMARELVEVYAGPADTQDLR